MSCFIKRLERLLSYSKLKLVFGGNCDASWWGECESAAAAVFSQSLQANQVTAKEKLSNNNRALCVSEMYVGFCNVYNTEHSLVPQIRPWISTSNLSQISDFIQERIVILA